MLAVWAIVFDQARFKFAPAWAASVNRLIKETLIESEFPCGTGTCRSKSNNLVMTQVIDFEAR